MTTLEKILKEIEEEALNNPKIGRKQCEGMARAINIIKKHLTDNCGTISIDDERLWQILFDEACVEGQQADRIYKQLKGICGDGWIPCSERMPEKPKENPEFENKKLEIYLVSIHGTKYSFRAFWNGESFTDGWTKVDVLAWRPLPEPYRPERSEE